MVSDEQIVSELSARQPFNATSLLRVNQNLQNKKLSGSIFEHHSQQIVIQNKLAMDVLKEYIETAMDNGKLTMKNEK